MTTEITTELTPVLHSLINARLLIGRVGSETAKGNESLDKAQSLIEDTTNVIKRMIYDDNTCERCGDRVCNHRERTPMPPPPEPSAPPCSGIMHKGG